MTQRTASPGGGEPPLKELSPEVRGEITASLKAGLSEPIRFKAGVLQTRIAAVEAAYPEARRILEGLNASQGSEEYEQSLGAVLDVVHSITPGFRAVTKDDLRGVTFLGGDRRELEGRSGLKVYPTTIVVPDELWGVILVEKLGSEPHQSGVSFNPENKPGMLHPFNKTGLNFMARRVASHHEDFHQSWRIYRSFGGGLVAELLSMGEDVKAGMATWDGVKEMLKSPGYLEEEEGWIRRVAGLGVLRPGDMGLSEAERRKVAEHEIVKLRSGRLIDDAVDTLAYLDRHAERVLQPTGVKIPGILPEAAVGPLLVETTALTQVTWIPDLLLMGEIKNQATQVLAGRQTWDGMWFDITKKFVGDPTRASTSVEREILTRIRLNRVEDRVEREIGEAKGKVEQLVRSYGEKDVWLIAMGCTTLNDFKNFRV